LDIQKQYTLEALSDYIRDSALLKLFKDYFISFVKKPEDIYLEFGHWAVIFQNRNYDPPALVINIESEGQTAKEFTPLDMVAQPSGVLAHFYGNDFLETINLPPKVFIGTKTAKVNIMYWGLDVIPSNPKSTLRFKEVFYSIFPPTLPTAWWVEEIKLLDLETNNIIDATTQDLVLMIVSERLTDSFGIFKPLFYRDISIAKYPFVRTTFNIRYTYIKGTRHLNMQDLPAFEFSSAIDYQHYLEKIIVDIIIKGRE